MRTQNSVMFFAKMGLNSFLFSPMSQASLRTSTFVYTEFKWGTVSGNYTNNTIQVVWGLGATGNFSDNITGLAQSTTYYFRATVGGDNATSGSELSFTTLAIPLVSIWYQ